MKATHLISAALVGVVLLIAAGVGVSFEAFSQLEEAGAARRASAAALSRVDALLSSLKDAETGERGFALTGDEAFLAPYLAARESVAGQQQELRRLTRIGAAQTHLDAVDPLIGAKLAELSKVIELRRKGDLPAMSALVAGGQGQRLMDSIRAELTGLARLEEVSLAQHEAELKSTMRRLFTGIVGASLLALLVALSFAVWIYRETQHRLTKLVHLETQHLLARQEETNARLQQLNATLQISEEKLAVTLNSIGDGVIATDASGRVTILNPLAERLTGWTQAKAAGRPVDEVFHIINQETRQPATIPVAETLARGTKQGLANHTVLIATDGHECAIADSCAPIRSREGQVVGAVLVFRDVTQEYAVQQALHDSTALVQAILSTVVDGIITLRASGGVIESVNPAVERMFGYTAAELIGRHVHPLIPDFDQGPGDGSVERHRTSEEARALSLEREVVGHRKDGKSFPLEIAVSEMWLGGKRYFTGILRDVTARKQTEAEKALLDQRLRDHQYYTRSLIESNIDAIMTTDPAGIITDVNKQMESLTGCTRDELIGAPFKNSFTEPERAEAAITLALVEKRVTNYELTARARDGQETVVSYNAVTLYDRERRLQGVFAAARDVTEGKRLDRVLQEKNVELESARAVADKANLAKSEFLSSMSHELRSPLNSILGFGQLMETESPAPTASQKESIAQILRAGWHLLKLIDEILDLAKVESGKTPLSREPVALADVLLECQGMVETQAQQRGLTLTFPRLDVPRYVSADRTRLKQVLLNLLSNAVKYNRPKGAVTVACDTKNPERTRISVRDAGAGLSPEQLGQLFQPFNRLGRETGPEEGTGIGLVVARKLVELMGGVIGVASTVGVGSVFWIELDSAPAPRLAAEAGDAAAPASPRAPRDGHVHTLLYVEDNPANLALVAQIVARHSGLRLLSAVDGGSGVELARSALPEVILMDINLPGINGFEALKLLRAGQATAHTPVIALSANAMPADIKRGLDAGFFRYITKPIKLTEFMAALDVALALAEPGPRKGRKRRATTPAP